MRQTAVVSSALCVGRKQRFSTKNSTTSMAVQIEEDFSLRRRLKAIESFEKVTLSTLVLKQRRETRRFLNRLRKSELLLKEHECTKFAISSAHNKDKKISKTGVMSTVDPKREVLSHSCDAEELLDCTDSEKNSSNLNNVRNGGAFSAKLKAMCDDTNVPYVKLSSYSKEDLKRPSTSLELKRKAWEKVSEHLDESRCLRSSSVNMATKGQRSVPKRWQEERKRFRDLTKVHLLSQLAPAPPQIDVQKVQAERMLSKRIEDRIVSEFCDSLNAIKVVLPPKFCWMSVNEVYSKSAKMPRKFEPISLPGAKMWQKLSKTPRTQRKLGLCFFRKIYDHVAIIEPIIVILKLHLISLLKNYRSYYIENITRILYFKYKVKIQFFGLMGLQN
ncbi:uncharacterized protein LOC124434699 [Xenia sp. Carnegie-2017]|uniref:uncharacterized protein LOC124434699 n=1 Tax=Xenia sp. Carnegie-2017 TaxID=2897299 RepID=UPI001F049723|nr:uncharacterized protein LOC124434699 [Xenia sp. Carnegie-2017]